MSSGGAQHWSHQFIDGNGNPYSGVKVYHTAAGTDTLKNVWTDEGKVTPAANPVVGDSRGMVSFYADGDYKLVIKDSADVTLYTWDNVKITSDTATLWEGNAGTAYPSAATANRWQQFLKHDASNNMLALGVNTGSAFKDITHGIYAHMFTSFTDAVTAADGKTLIIMDSITLPSGAITIPATVLGVLVIAPGVIAKGSATSLTINAPVVGNPMHQWLSGFAAGEVTLPSYIPSYPDWFAVNTTPGTTNMTTAFNSAWRSNGNVEMKATDYLVDGIIIATASVGDRTKDNIRIIGKGRKKSRLILNTVAGGGQSYGLKLQGLVAATPQGFNETINDILLSEFSVVGQESTSSGIEVVGGYRVELNNMSASGNKYGVNLRSCININFSGIADFAGNNVGIKVPEVDVSGSATIDTYNFGANVINFDLLIVRSSVYAGLSIGLGSTWTVNTMLAENLPVAMYMMEQCNNITINTLYLENNAEPTLANHAVKSQFGAYRFWAMFQGQDEDGNVSTIGLNKNIAIHNVYDTNNHLCHLYKMQQLEVRYLIGAGGYEIAGDCSYIDVTGGNYKETTTIVPGVGRTVAHKVGLKSGYNLVANGNNYFPNMHANDSSGTVTRTQTTMDDTGNTNVTRLTLAIGAASVEHKIYLPRAMYGDYADRAALNLLAEAHVKASASTITNIKIKLTNQAGAILAGGNEINITDYTNPTKTRTNWNTITCIGTTALTDSPNGSYLVITATRTDTTGTDYLWIADVIVRDAWIEYINSPSIFDVLAGYCFRGTTSVSDAGRFYVQFTIPNDLYYATYYEVVATAYGTANEGVSVVKANGSFKVYTTSTGISVVAQLIPLQAISA